MQLKGPQTYSHEELTSIRKADAARGKGSPPRPAPPPGKYYHPKTGCLADIPPETNIDYENVSRDKAIKQKAASAKDAPPSIPDLHYLDKTTGDWVHIPPEVETFDPAIKARVHSFRRIAAVEKDKISPPVPIRPPAPQGWTDSTGKGWTQTRPDDMVETSEGNWIPKSHPDASIRHFSAVSNDRSLRIEHLKKEKDQPYPEDHLKRAHLIIAKIENVRNTPETERPQLEIQQSL